MSSKRILIVGGSGSWGNELARQLLLTTNDSITIFSRNEYQQVKMQRKFNNDRLKFVIGDVRDYESVNLACYSVDIVFLLSALKHVPICEEQPDEAIKTNIIGTQNVIKACINQNVYRCIDVSSDKACSANTLYGATKFIGEKLIINANKYEKTIFTCIRSGNVLGTNGSVVPLFIDQIKKNNQMTITDRLMTRYFLSLPEAINLLLTAMNAPAGSLLVMKMPSCTIGDLAETLKDLYGDKNTSMQEIGIRPSEKKHETLISSEETPVCYIYNSDYYVIYPEKLGLQKVKFKEYTSNNQILLTKPEIKDMLDRGGFLI